MWGRQQVTIMELTVKNTIEEFDSRNVDFDYHKVKETDAWRINFAKELVEIRGGDLEVQGIESDELQQILEYICTGWWNFLSFSCWFLSGSAFFPWSENGFPSNSIILNTVIIRLI